MQGSTREIQNILTKIGIDVGNIDGKRGPKTRAGIKRFQKIFGLKMVDGIAGPETWKYLNKAKKVKHFKVREFACRHCGEIKIDINLLLKLEELRKQMGNRPIIINSGYRCKTHNNNVRGAKRSQHLYGRAADFRVKGYSPQYVYIVADRINQNGGVGKYPSFTHIDTRGYRARW